MLPDAFTVTLLSNASLAEYPENTFLKFTNILNKNLLLPLNDEWKVCLHSITLTCDITSTLDTKRLDYLTALKGRAKRKLSLAINKKDLNAIARRKLKKKGLDVKTLEKINYMIASLNKALLAEKQKINLRNSLFIVKTSIIDPKHGQPPELAKLIVPKYDPVKQSTLTYHPQTNEYFNLTSSDISKIDIEITDPFGNSVRAATGQSTVVVLKFRKMRHNHMEYNTLRLESIGNPLDFRIRFPDSLLKDGQINPWEVALAKITYPPHFSPFPKDGSFPLALYRRTEKFQEWLNDYTNKTKMREALAQKSFEIASYPKADQLKTVGKFINYMQTEITAVCDEHDWVRITLGNSNGHLSITSTNDIVLQFPVNIGMALGISTAKTHQVGQSMLLDLKKGKSFKGDYKVDPNVMIPKNLLIYTDCVEPSLIGNVYGQYLTNIPVPISNINELLVSYEPKNLEFHRIQTGDLGNVNFQILQTDGNYPALANDNYKIFMTLLFRKKKK